MKRLVNRLYKGWMVFAHALGRVQTYLILSVIYFLAVGMTSFLMRLFTGDPLDRRLHDRASFWTPKEPTNSRLEEARRPF